MKKDKQVIIKELKEVMSSEYYGEYNEWKWMNGKMIKMFPALAASDSLTEFICKMATNLAMYRWESGCDLHSSIDRSLKDILWCLKKVD